VHGAHAELGDDQVGAGVVDVAGELAHGAGEDAPEHQHQQQRDRNPAG
jgi:hypothetical protein